ncbi:hypothetical protein TIFTF001_001537 [Ficus carica]|uniref:Uncharacterized protein n=1 Tax=Ficus carica TaxID=3494 RepID=A0AA88CMG1_FICCA|nr:hypothetical protein TIFTF001_001537 [Ficus carica]
MSSNSSEEVSSVELIQARNLLWNVSLGHIKAMALQCAIELGIPDIIHNHGGESIPLSKLIEALPVHLSKAHCVPRLMRILVHLGFFGTTKKNHDQEEEEEYSLNVASRLLLDKAGPLIISMKPGIALSLFPKMVTSFSSLSTWFRNSDATLSETVGGSSFYDLLEHNPEIGHIFNEAMSNDSKIIAHLALKDCKEVFEGLKSLVDLGGGTGSLAKAITNSFPHLHCTVFDLPHVVADLQESEKLTFAGGDMFSDPIPPADAILLKTTLHNWSEQECLAILKKCREAVLSNGKKGKVIIIEMVIGCPINLDKVSYELQLSYDIMMMTMSGKERTAAEWKNLFKNAGFSHCKITPLLGEKSFIEVFP